MKWNNVIIYALMAVLLLPSCSNQNEVITGRTIQKRKYNKGFHHRGQKWVKKRAPQREREEEVVMDTLTPAEAKVFAFESPKKLSPRHGEIEIPDNIYAKNTAPTVSESPKFTAATPPQTQFKPLIPDLPIEIKQRKKRPRKEVTVQDAAESAVSLGLAMNSAYSIGLKASNESYYGDFLGVRIFSGAIGFSAMLSGFLIGLIAARRRKKSKKKWPKGLSTPTLMVTGFFVVIALMLVAFAFAYSGVQQPT